MAIVPPPPSCNAAPNSTLCWPVFSTLVAALPCSYQHRRAAAEFVDNVQLVRNATTAGTTYNNSRCLLGPAPCCLPTLQRHWQQPASSRLQALTSQEAIAQADQLRRTLHTHT